MQKVPVTTANQADWNRKAANVINVAVQKDGVSVYAGDTAGAAYNQAKMQALMDAVEALSNRLK